MNDNTGHGHVWARPDGMKARCGGPALCSACRADAERVRMHALDKPATSPISGMPGALQADLERLLNAHSRENASNTPDFILANYMLKCLEAFETASRSRESWYGKSLRIGG